MQYINLASWRNNGNVAVCNRKASKLAEAMQYAAGVIFWRGWPSESAGAAMIIGLRNGKAAISNVMQLAGWRAAQRSNQRRNRLAAQSQRKLSWRNELQWLSANINGLGSQPACSYGVS
jgi:hypothetical protein